MRVSTRAGALAFGFAALAACATDVPPASSPAQGPAVTSLESIAEAALADAERRTGMKRTDLKVLGAEAVTWSDGSLGCPQPGMMYTQALVQGYRVRIQAGGEVLEYHASRVGQPAFCPADRVRPPLPDASI